MNRSPEFPGGFRTIFAPVSTNLGNLRWLSNQLSREPDFYEENVALYGIYSVNVHDRATVDGHIGAPNVELGSRSLVDGSIYTVEHFLREKANFTGTLQTYAGEYQSVPQWEGKERYWLTEFPTDQTNQCIVNVANEPFTGPIGWTNYDPPNSGTRIIDLSPGQYGHVRVKRDVVLRLEPGVFHFRSLDIGSGGRLEKLGVAPTYVYVEDLLDFKGQTGELPGQLTVMSATTRPIHFHGADPTSAEPDFQGTVFAPFAKVDIHTNYYFAGQVIASDIEVHQDSVVEYRAPELRSICEPY